jgi:hypothetical protein
LENTELVIEKVFEQLRNDNVCRTAHEFSEDFLGRSPSYYSMLKARRREPSTEALLTLELSLRSAARIFESNRYPYFVRTHKHLLELVECVTALRQANANKHVSPRFSYFDTQT